LAGTWFKSMVAVAASRPSGLTSSAVTSRPVASPLGPCAKATTQQPLHASDGSVAGPGGATVITGPAGDVWLAHHGWAPGVIGYAAGGVRSLRFTSLRWDGAQLTVHPRGSG
jgi:hypothetical protein